MARYALVIDGVVTEEREYDAPPATKVRDGKPLLRPIVVKAAQYDPETQTYTVSRQVQNHKVVDTWVVTDLPPEAVAARLEAKRRAAMPPLAEVVEALVESLLDGRPEKLEAIRAKRLAVDARYPAPVKAAKMDK